MTIEEKLNHFLEASLNICKSQSEQMIGSYKQTLESEYAQNCSDIDRTVTEKLRLERDRLTKAHNHKLAGKEALIKKELGDTHDNLKNKLFEEVRLLLDDFMRSEQYPGYLVEKYKAAIGFAGADDIILYLDPADAPLKDTIEARLGHKLVICESSFGGGCIAEIPAHRIRIDNSFRSGFEERKKEFTFNGGGLNDQDR